MEITFCNVILVVGVLIILCYFAYNISKMHQIQEPFSNSKSKNSFQSGNNLKKLKNKNNRKLNKINTNNNKKKTNNSHRDKIKERMENIEIKDDDSHILDAQYIKDKTMDFYYSFDNKLMNNKESNLRTFNKKWDFMKEQFWNIFNI